MTRDSTADVIGIVKSASDVQQVTSPKLGGKTLSKRDLIIFDDSDSDIRLTLWGDKNSHSNVNFNDQNLTIAIKGITIQTTKKYSLLSFSHISYSYYHIHNKTLGARVGDFQGRNLNTIPTTTVTFNAPEGLQLSNWLQQHITSDTMPTTTSLTNSTSKLLLITTLILY